MCTLAGQNGTHRRARTAGLGVISTTLCQLSYASCLMTIAAIQPFLNWHNLFGATDVDGMAIAMESHENL